MDRAVGLFDKLKSTGVQTVNVGFHTYRLPCIQCERKRFIYNLLFFCSSQNATLTRGTRVSLVSWYHGQLMSETVRVEKLDEVFMRVHCDDGLAKDLHDFFSFTVLGCKFMRLIRTDIGMAKLDYSLSKQIRFI